MTIPVRRFPVVRAQIVALLVAIGGMIVQIASGVPFPKVPPGIVILVVLSVLLAFWSPAWVRLLGAIVPGLILIAGLVSPIGRADISNPAELGVFSGTLLQFLGLAVACAAGIAYVAEWRASRRLVDSP